MAVGTVRNRKTLAAIATGTALMIVAQLATVFSMTILSAWESAGQQRHRWLGEVWPSLTSLVSSRSFGLVQRLHHRRSPSHARPAPPRIFSIALW